MTSPPPPDLDPTTSFTPFQDAVFSDVMSAVKSASALASNDLDFHRSSDPTFASALDATQKRILDLTNALLKSAADGSDIAAPRLTSEDDVDDKWPAVVDVADFLLERADTCLDEYTGAIKQKHPEPLPGAAKQLSGRQRKSQNFKAHSYANRTMAKPQLLFEVKPDNMDTSPFKPLLTVKPHAIVPLEESLKLVLGEDGKEHYDHPYRAEIEAMEYPKEMFEVKEPEMYKPFEETEAVYVDDAQGLVAMLEELKKATVIAVDLEHHDSRSYVGFVCLMQISTREKDWIVDTLKLRSELQILNEVFADPKIIKVLHGAFMDIIWLQRDFGLYVVGLFDTYFAAKTLGFAGHGLAFLLKKYVDFDADKQYQLADWRMRPLPEEMLTYARSDTHFLLYIFDNIRNALLEHKASGYVAPEDPESNKMKYTLEQSKETALRLYERESYDAENGTGTIGWRNMLGRSNDSLNVMQFAVFKAVHHWRDTTARREDEGHHYVMPKHQIFTLAREMPTDVPGILTCCHPATPLVRQRVAELVYAIRTAKESPEVKEWQENLQKQEEERIAFSTSRSAKPSPEQQSKASSPQPQHIRFNAGNAFPQTPSSLRAETSRFWGQTAVSSLWTPATKNIEIRLAVPLPELTAQVFVAHDSTPAAPTPVDPGARAEHEYVKNRAAKPAGADVMVVRQVGGGRKRKLSDAELETPKVEETETGPAPSSPQPTPATPSEDAPPTPEKKKKRKSKKELAAEAEKSEFTPFDYAAAPSVLNGKKNVKDPAKVRSRKKKPAAFDPYIDSSNASERGMSRAQHERAGRAKTFK